MPLRHSCLAVLLLALALSPARAETIPVVVQMKFSSSAPLFDPQEIDRTVTKELREKFGARMAKDLGNSDFSAEQLTPSTVRFSYIGRDVTGRRHAQLDIQVNFYDGKITDEDAEKLWGELNKTASPGAVEVFSEHLNALFEQQQKSQKEQSQQLRERLEQELDELQMSIQEIQDISFEGGSAALQAHIEELTKRQRDDEIRLIELQAQRAAIEKRIDRLRTQAAEQQQDDPLLAALRAEVKRLEQSAASMRVESSPLEAAKEILAAQEILYKEAESLREHGISAAGLEKARVQLAEARLRVAQLQIDSRNRETLHMEKLSQARIALLQHERGASAGRVGEQIGKLSDMLDELAIEMDTILGRRNGIKAALTQLQDDFRKAMGAELKRQKYDSKIKLLEQRRLQVEQLLLELENEALQPSPEKIEIQPVIP